MSGKKKKAVVSVPVPGPKVAAKQAFNPGSVPRWAIFVVLVLTAIIYSRALQNGITFVDDDEYILKNPYLRDFSFNGVKAIFTSFYEYNYHPLTTLTWLLEFRLFGLNPLPYHALNVLLHLICTWLVYKLAWRLSGKTLTGLVVATLFALHPLHVETVAWISERKGLLSALFYFLSLLCYLRYIDGGYIRKYYVLSLIVFIAALLSKSAAVTLPVLMLVIDWYRGRKITRGTILEKVPFLLLAALFGVLAIMSQAAGGAVNDITVEYGIANRISIFTTGLAFYIVKAVAPFHLSVIHYFPNMDNGMLPWYFYASVPFLAAVVWLIRRPGTMKKEVLFGSAFFLVVISVMLQLLTVGSAYAAERYTYVSYFGLFYIAGQWFADHVNGKRGGFTAAAVVLVAAFALISWKRVEVWKDTDTIMADIVEKNEGNSNNYLVYFHWGDYKQRMGRSEEAVELYSKAIDIKPDYARAYLFRGEALGSMNNIIGSIMNYNEVIRLEPKSAIAYSDKGWAYFEMGDKVLSVAYLDTAIMLDPKLATAYNNRGWMSLQAHDTMAALKDFNKALANNPSFIKAYYNRALIKLNSGDVPAAIDDYNKLISIDPTDHLAHYYKGIAYLKVGNRGHARIDLRKAAALGNRDAESVLRDMQ